MVLVELLPIIGEKQLVFELSLLFMHEQLVFKLVFGLA